MSRMPDAVAELLDVGVVMLAGPGALSAARALLVATVCRAEAVIAGVDLAELLGGVPDTEITRLTVLDTPEGAVSYLDVEMLYRIHDGLGGAVRPVERLPAVVLFLRPGSRWLRRRTAVLLRTAQHYNLAAVVLTDDEAALRVAEDGSVPGGGQVALMSAAEAREALMSVA